MIKIMNQLFHQMNFAMLKKDTNLGELFFLDLNKNEIKQDINSNKSKKFNTSEIRKLILPKPRFV